VRGNTSETASKWSKGTDIGGTKFGHAFDLDDILMRLSRNPCDTAKDATECKCETPCRQDTYRIMAGCIFHL
jgi:hypothetical protein